MGKRCDRSLPLSARGYVCYRLVEYVEISAIGPKEFIGPKELRGQVLIITVVSDNNSVMCVDIRMSASLGLYFR